MHQKGWTAAILEAAHKEFVLVSSNGSSKFSPIGNALVWTGQRIGRESYVNGRCTLKNIRCLGLCATIKWIGLIFARSHARKSFLSTPDYHQLRVSIVNTNRCSLHAELELVLICIQLCIWQPFGNIRDRWGYSSDARLRLVPNSTE